MNIILVLLEMTPTRNTILNCFYILICNKRGLIESKVRQTLRKRIQQCYAVFLCRLRVTTGNITIAFLASVNQTFRLPAEFVNVIHVFCHEIYLLLLYAKRC